MIGNELHSFIASCFVNEANKEKVKVYLDYHSKSSYNFGDGYDIYLPDGLSLLGNNYKPPFYVEVKTTIHHNIRFLRFLSAKSSEPDFFGGTFFVITNESDDSILKLCKDYSISGNSVIIFGRSFIGKLKERNRTAYLNYLLGTGDVVIGKDNDLNLYLKDKIKVITDSQLMPTRKNIVKINKKDANDICKENENDFKAYLHDDKDYSKCAVFIGNGVSIPFGSDSWGSMIKNLLDRLKPFYIEDIKDVENFLSNSSYALASFVKNTMQREEENQFFYDAIRYCIYRKYNEKIMHNQKSLVKAIALAKIKNPKMPLLTYNYDTFVEKQYYVETKKSLNYFCEKYTFDKEKMDSMFLDNVIHLHGYISYTGNKHKGIILTDDDYYNAYLHDSWTKRVQIDVLKKYKCLFVGSSMSDLFQLSVIQEARKKETNWDCFALVCLKGLQFKEKMQVIQYYKEKRIRLISADSFEELPKKLADLFGFSL